MYLLGYDVGSSSVKAALVEADTGICVARAQYPDTEMAIHAPQAGWAEQDPEQWWEALVHATHRLWLTPGIDPAHVRAIGISYQMHGLVVLDKNGEVLRPSIIWCDSRAVAIGENSFQALGASWCMNHLLNSPGNFTAAKLAWVKENEPALFDRITHFCLPGDYIAYRLSGELQTTASGLSEGILWDFAAQTVATPLLQHFGISGDLIPSVVPNIGISSQLSASAAADLKLPTGIPIAYRAGDQPNNALSLGVIAPGQVAATGGTSGVVYAVSDQLVADPAQRVNTFAHVNHQLDAIRTGILLCINGAGIQYGWLRRMVGQGMDYPAMENLAHTIAPGSDGLTLLPFGNGAERMLQNKTTGAQLSGLDLNRHHQAHLIRATLEGIAFAFVYGMKQLQKQGVALSQMRAGNDNLFQSAIFSNTIASLSGCHIQLVKTTGAIGAAQAAGAGVGIYQNLEEAVSLQTLAEAYAPAPIPESLATAYSRWEQQLELALSNS